MDDDELLIPRNDGALTHVNETVGNTDGRSREDVAAVEETKSNFERIGIAQIVLGVISLIVSIVIFCGDFYRSALSSSFSGFWCGIFAIACGSLAITLKYQLTYPVVIANLVLSILASVFGTILTIFSAVSAVSVVDSPGQTYIAFPVFETLIAMAWTTLSVYHLIVVARVMVLDKRVTSTICCFTHSSMPQSYPPVAMAYIPPGTFPDGAPNVFMAVPQSARAQAPFQTI